MVFKSRFNSPYRGHSKEYNLWYNHNFRGRGLVKRAKSRIRYRCMSCGLIMPSANRLGLYPPEVFVHIGYRVFFSPFDKTSDPNVLYIYREKQKGYEKEFGLHSIEVLRGCIAKGLLSKDFVISSLGVEHVFRESFVDYSPSFDYHVPLEASREYNVEVL